MNADRLKENDILWADIIFISTMSIQSESANEVITRCNELNAKIAAGGPLFTSSPELYPKVDFLILNEAEITLPHFLRDLSEGETKQIYTATSGSDFTPAY